MISLTSDEFRVMSEEYYQRFKKYSLSVIRSDRDDIPLENVDILMHTRLLITEFADDPDLTIQYLTLLKSILLENTPKNAERLLELYDLVLGGNPSREYSE